MVVLVFIPTCLFSCLTLYSTEWCILLKKFASLDLLLLLIKPMEKLSLTFKGAGSGPSLKFQHKTLHFPDSCMPSVREGQSPAAKIWLTWAASKWESDQAKHLQMPVLGRRTERHGAAAFRDAQLPHVEGFCFPYWVSVLFSTGKFIYPLYWLNNAFIFDPAKLQIVLMNINMIFWPVGTVIGSFSLMLKETSWFYS